MQNREEFLKRIQSITIEKEPRTNVFKLTKKTVKEELEKCDKVLKSENI